MSRPDELGGRPPGVVGPGVGDAGETYVGEVGLTVTRPGESALEPELPGRIVGGELGRTEGVEGRMLPPLPPKVDPPDGRGAIEGREEPPPPEGRGAMLEPREPWPPEGRDTPPLEPFDPPMEEPR